MPSTASSFCHVATKEDSRSGLPKSSRPNPSALVYCALSLLALFVVKIGSRGPENGSFQLPGSLLCNNLVVTCHLILGLPVFALKLAVAPRREQLRHEERWTNCIMLPSCLPAAAGLNLHVSSRSILTFFLPRHKCPSRCTHALNWLEHSDSLISSSPLVM